MSVLSIEAKQAGKGIAHLKVVGSLDAVTYEKMEKQIADLFVKLYFKIIINMEQVKYISSAGAGVFISAIGTAQDHNGNIVLLKPSLEVKDVFTNLGLEEIFLYAETLEEAIKKLQ